MADRPSVKAGAFVDPVDAKARRGRNLSLDGLRGCAAMSVVLGHCALIAGGIGIWMTSLRDFPSMPWSDIGLRLLSAALPSDAAVMVFFVLSGHVLWTSFARKDLHFVADLPDYVCARVYRLFPLTIISALPLGFLKDASALALVSNMLLLSDNLNGVLWSLQVEVVASIGLFALWGITSGVGWKLVLALILGLGATPFFRGNPYVVFFPAFILGALISCFPARIWHQRGILPVGIGILLLTNLVLGHGGITRCFEMIGATVLVGSVAAGRLPVLCSRVPLLLGAISYPLYLTHPIVLGECGHLFASVASGQQLFGRLVLLALITLAVSFPIAWLLHVCVEDPALRSRPRLTFRRRVRRPDMD